VGIPAFVSFVVPIDMPAFSAEETSKVVGYQARQYIPLPISEVSLDWLKIEEYQSERGEIFQRILLMAIPNEVIRKYRTIFKAVGVAVTALEIESLALVRALRGSDNKLTLSVDIGAEATSIVISENGIVKYQSSTDYGGIYLTQALSRSLGISLSRAEELKRRRGLLGAGGEMELSTLLTPFLDVIIQECRHVKDVYERRYGKTVTKLCLVGGGANLPGIEKYFSEEIGLPILTPPIFSGLSYDPNLEPAVKTLSNALLPAIGLAKRYFQ
jgi:type IV pilus assembly protein PilM